MSDTSSIIDLTGESEMEDSDWGEWMEDAAMFGAEAVVFFEAPRSPSPVPPRSPSPAPVREHVIFLESLRSPSPVSERGAPPTSPPETLEERRQFQEVLVSVTPLETLGWEAAPLFHAASAPLLSQQVSGGGATYEELACQLRPLLIQNILRELRLPSNAGIVRQIVRNELSLFLNILRNSV